MYAQHASVLDAYNELLEDLGDLIEEMDGGDLWDVADIFERLKKIHPNWND